MKTKMKKISTTVTKNIGKPITESNDYGMYCENYCGQDEDKSL